MELEKWYEKANNYDDDDNEEKFKQAKNFSQLVKNSILTTV